MKNKYKTLKNMKMIKSNKSNNNTINKEKLLNL